MMTQGFISKRTIGGVAALLAIMAAPAAAQTTPTDLSTWTREGTGGTWTVAADNHSVTQSLNGTPTVFYSDFNAFNHRLSGTIRVNTTTDDDFIGFVVGFNPGELSSAGEFYLIDWKQTAQTFFGFAPAGLALSRVANGLFDNRGAWAHDPAQGVTELARGATLGSVGWTDLTTYAFDLTYSPTTLALSVNGVQQFSRAGNYSDGRFGFYNYSQQSVTYAGISDAIVPPSTGAVPEPASWALMIIGFGAAGAMLRRRRGVPALA